MDILVVCTAMTVLAMGPMVLLAWHRLRIQEIEE